VITITSPLHHAAELPFCMCQLLHFCHLLSNPSIDPKLEYISGKPVKCRFQRCIVHAEILSTFHAWVEYISLTKYAIETIGPVGQMTPKSSLPLEACGPYLMHECLGWPHSPPQTASRSNQPFCHNTLCGPTDRPSDRQMVQRMFRNMSTPLAMLIESDALIKYIMHWQNSVTVSFAAGYQLQTEAGNRS